MHRTSRSRRIMHVTEERVNTEMQAKLLVLKEIDLTYDKCIYKIRYSAQIK